MKNVLGFLALLLLFSACEKDIEIKPKDGKDLVVVEGHIEPGVPPYVLLTKTQSFFSTTDINTLNGLFISGATVKVSDGTEMVDLQEFNSDSLPGFLADTLSQRLGIKIASRDDPSGLRVIVYSTLNMTGQEGRTYNLEINTANQQLTSVTSIPFSVGIDSLWTVPHPTNDTLVSLYVRYSDPVGERNFVRYFTSVNGDLFEPPRFVSTLDDRGLINVDGKTLDFAIEQGHNWYEKIDYQTSSYFTKGDSIILRWCSIDQAHYDFWSTAEFSRSSGGSPFSSPVVIKSNIMGGLGVWGGYNPSYYFLIAE